MRNDYLRNMKRSLLVFLFMGCFSSLVVAQQIKDSAIFTPLISASYTFQFPMGDLEKRFGFHSTIGVNADFKLSSNWVFGASGNFTFGNNVKDTSMLRDLTTSDGQIININGESAKIVAFQRGYSLTANVGKVFSVIGPNPNSGLMLKLGVGYWRHRIRFDSQSDLVPQLTGAYKKLYDRLTEGVMITEFIGYQHMSNSRMANFYGGIEFRQGFMKGIRQYQAGAAYDGQAKRTDMSIGLKIGWIIPIHKRAPKEYYFD